MAESPGSVAAAGAGLTAPSQGSTVGDLSTAVTGFLAGLDQRRREEEAKALEEAKLAVQRDFADAQMTQAAAMSEQVAGQLEHQAFTREIQADAAAREEEVHDLTVRRTTAEVSALEDSRESIDNMAPVNRSALRRAAMNDPKGVPWSVSDVDAMDPLTLADNYRWLQDNITARTNQQGAVMGSVLSSAREAVLLSRQGVLEAQDRRNAASQQWQQAYEAATGSGFYNLGEDGQLTYKLEGALTPEEEAQVAQMDQVLQESNRVLQDAENRYQEALKDAADQQLIQQQYMRDIATAMGISADRLAGGQPNPETGEDPTRVSEDTLSALYIAFQQDPGLFRQQMDALARRKPGAAAQFMEYAGVDEAALQQAMGRQDIQSLDSLMAAGADGSVAAMADSVLSGLGESGASPMRSWGREEVEAWTSITQVFKNRAGRESLFDPGQTSVALAGARAMREAGVSRATFQQMMEANVQPSRDDVLYQYILDSWPNRIGSGGGSR